LIDQFLNKSGLVPGFLKTNKMKNKYVSSNVFIKFIGFEGSKGVLVQNRGELLNLDVEKTDYVLGKELYLSD